MHQAIITPILLVVFAICSAAQTTEFTYQGSLKDGASSANANYDFEFRLFAVDAGGTALGTIQRLGVPVSSGSFNVKLDFGAQFTGALRYLEIGIRPAGGGGFTTLAPRQQISNTPYSVRSLNAATADNATNASTAASAATATNALQLGSIAANQYVLTTDPRMTDPRPPTAGSNNYIQNGTTQQSASAFNVSGDGTVGGTLSAGAISAGSINTPLQYNIGNLRAFTIFDSLATNTNTLVGVLAGGQVSTGRFNSFFGCGAGQSTSTADGNSSFGCGAGGQNTLGANNTFLGRGAGNLSSSGNDNTFVGRNAGAANTTGGNNTIIGSGANVAFNNLNFAAAIGAGASVSGSNTLVLGRGTDTVQIPGSGRIDARFSVGGGLQTGDTVSVTSNASNPVAISGYSSQPNSGAAIRAVNTNSTGIGLIAVGGNVTVPGYQGFSFGLAALGARQAIEAQFTSANPFGYAIYTNGPLGNALINFYDGTTQFKIAGAGVVSTVVRDSASNSRVLFAPEAPEVLFEDYGSGKLVDGRAQIDLDPVLAANVRISEAHPLRVFIQLEGDCNGVYVTNKTARGFEVVELQGGKSNVGFTWHIVANRADEELSNPDIVPAGTEPPKFISHYEDLRFPLRKDVRQGMQMEMTSGKPEDK